MGACMKKIIFTGIIAGIFGADLYIKNRIETGSKIKALPGVTVTKYHNYGACRNLGDKKPALIRLVSVIFTMIITVIFVVTLGKTGKNLLKTGLAFLLGGAFSNSYDRVRRGYVVDYIRFKTPWKWLNDMIFNISDFFIIIGAMFAAFGV